MMGMWARRQAHRMSLMERGKPFSCLPAPRYRARRWCNRTWCRKPLACLPNNGLVRV